VDNFNWNDWTTWPGIRSLAIENPVIELKRLREDNARTRFLDHNEIERLLGAAKPDLRPIIITALHTGMRRGEIFDLTWQNVDFRNRIITVQKSKSGKQKRIPMEVTLFDTLKTLPSRFKKGLVFPSPKTGKRRDNIKKAFRNALKKANLEDVRFHDLRYVLSLLMF
jgi:integrase